MHHTTLLYFISCWLFLGFFSREWSGLSHLGKTRDSLFICLELIRYSWLAFRVTPSSGALQCYSLISDIFSSSFLTTPRGKLRVAPVSKVVCLGHVSKQNHWPPMTKSWDQPGKECRLSPELFWQRTAANDCDHRGELRAVAFLSFFPASKFDHAALHGATGIRELSEWHAGCACILRQGEAARTLCQRASAAMVSGTQSEWQPVALERFWLIILSS